MRKSRLKVGQIVRMYGWPYKIAKISGHTPYSKVKLTCLPMSELERLLTSSAQPTIRGHSVWFYYQVQDLYEN